MKYLCRINFGTRMNNSGLKPGVKKQTKSVLAGFWLAKHQNRNKT